jgi:hypothetical protein
VAQAHSKTQKPPAGSRPRSLVVASLVVLCAGLAWAPRLVDGYLALQWTRHLAARSAGTPRVQDARPQGRWAARTVDDLAPLPQAWEAARLALEVARRLRLKDAAAARALVTPVREALERAERSAVRGYGLGTLREEATEVENTLLPDPDPGVQP